MPKMIYRLLRRLIDISVFRGMARATLTTATCHHGRQEKSLDMGLIFPTTPGYRRISVDMVPMPLMTAE